MTTNLLNGLSLSAGMVTKHKHYQNLTAWTISFLTS